MSDRESADDNTLIETIDAVGGLKIEIWSGDFQHALEGHPEVTIENIRQTVKDPFKVVQSKRSNRACLFYSFEAKVDNAETIYFCVVVSLLDEGRGKLETAYEADYVKTGTVLFEKKEASK